MTLSREEIGTRDYFAAAALAGLCANPGGPFQASATYGWALTNCAIGDIAKTAYDCADAMLYSRTPTPAPEAKCDWCGGPHVRDVFHAADLQPPAPEAKRPTVDRAYDRVVAVRDYLDLLVSIQPETRRITAALAASIGYVLPAPCPPPVAGSAEKDEAFKALLAYAECEEAAWGQNDEWEAVLMRHGMEKGAHPHEFLGTLRTKALALSRPVRP